MTATRTVHLVVIDYGAGNLRSVVRALANIGASFDVTNTPDEIRAAQAVILPGVGATADTMDSLRRLGIDVVVNEVVQSGRPFLGICVGMQVLCEWSEEFGSHSCLGVVPGHVRRLPIGQKVPQIGWNQVCYNEGFSEHPLFDGIPNGSDFYFVHSYYCDLTDRRMIAATTEYALDFPSVLIRERLAAVQFHPEKSGRWGLRLLTNFVSWAGADGHADHSGDRS